MISKPFRELLLKVQTHLQKVEALKVAFDKAKGEYDEANKERLTLEGEIQKHLHQDHRNSPHLIVTVGEETWMLTNQASRFDSIVRKVQVEK